ncbi:MAG TPA: hypothetical protein VHA33_30220 [Candidatus Angelobacter sp.]|jgi:hypothetical protein|nr:hypothetical protein [Candidatus Angelobacter sp.]
MSTTTIEARCNARPTRLAFIVPTPDRDLLLSVIARATSLWGGIFNPIIILDDSTREVRGIQEEMSSHGEYLEDQADLLKAFDPDFVANFSADPLPQELKAFQHRTFAAERLDWRSQQNCASSYFVDVWPILDELWEKEFKFSAKPAFQLQYLEKPDARKSLLLAAKYGLYSNDDSYAFLKKNFGAEAIVYDAEFKSALMPETLHTPLALTRYQCTQNRQIVHSHAYFLLNPDHPFDVVDFWNLRAAGMILFPLTLEDYKEFEQPIRHFGALAAYPINEKITNHVVLVKARSISEEELTTVADWIRSLGFLKDFSTMGWVPRYSMDYYGVANEIDVKPISAYDSSAVGILDNGYGVIQGPIPEFLRSEHYDQHWSMDLSFFTSHNPDMCYRLPWLNSGCDGLVQAMIGGGFDMDGAHISRSGIVTQHAGTTGDVRMSPITVVEAVKAFLQGKDIEYLKTSTPGLTLERIIEMFNGLRDCELFQNVAIRELLDNLASGGSLVAREVRGAIHKSLKGFRHFGQPTTRDQIVQKVDAILDQAVRSKVFRIGLVFQCSRCRRHNWYAVTEFDDSFNCKSCFAREVTPRLDATKWHYASDGFFRTSNKLDGNITILLTLNFFDYTFDHRMQFTPSFDYTIDGEPHEMDFAIISSGGMFSREVEMIFGESKSGTALNEDERKKLKSFGAKTGSYICFCTMADDFDDTDKAFFRDLVDARVKIIMLTRFFLEMNYFELRKYRHANNPGRSRTKTDWLMRMTILRTLGDDFAHKHHIWL